MYHLHAADYILAVPRPREGGLRRGENFWLRLLQPLRLSERFFSLSLTWLSDEMRFRTGFQAFITQNRIAKYKAWLMSFKRSHKLKQSQYERLSVNGIKRIYGLYLVALLQRCPTGNVCLYSPMQHWWSHAQNIRNLRLDQLQQTWWHTFKMSYMLPINQNHIRSKLIRS